MKRLILSVFLYVITGSILVCGQTNIKESTSLIGMESKFQEAKELMEAFRNDPAIAILEKLENQLISKNNVDGPFGLKVQDKLAEALEMDHKDEEAIEKLLHVSAISLEKENWEVYGNANVSLARLFEKIGREERCLNHLNIARGVIKKNNLESIYPRLSIRLASYHRIFADRDSAMYFTHEAIRSSAEQDKIELKGTGHLLMGLLLSYDDPNEALSNFNEAIEIWNKIGDYAGVSYAHNNMSRILLRQEKYDLALARNDSTIIAATIATEKGHDFLPIFTAAYKFRSDLYEKQNRLDSALFYSNLAHKTELEHISATNNAQIVEIDAKYNEQKQLQIIAEQNNRIEIVSQRTLLFRLLFFTVFTLGLFLLFFYLKLLRTKRFSDEQTLEIKQNNASLSKSVRKQKVLQSELHHRVKNNLQVIISLVEMQMEEIGNSETISKLENLINRIHGMSATQELFNSREVLQELSLDEFVTEICNKFPSNFGSKIKHDIELDVASKVLHADTLMPLGMIIHELLSNSFKHFNSVHKSLKINILIKVINGNITMKYHDNGPGFPSGKLIERAGGLGTYLLSCMVRQLDGVLETKNDDGAVFQFKMKEKI